MSELIERILKEVSVLPIEGTEAGQARAWNAVARLCVELGLDFSARKSRAIDDVMEFIEKGGLRLSKSEIGFLALCVRQQNHKDEKSAKKFIERDGKLIAASGLEIRLKLGRKLKTKLRKLQKETV